MISRVNNLGFKAPVNKASVISKNMKQTSVKLTWNFLLIGSFRNLNVKERDVERKCKYQYLISSISSIKKMTGINFSGSELFWGCLC